MNPRLSFAIAALAMTAGCAGTNGSNSLTPFASLSDPAKTPRKLYVTNYNGSVLVYSAGRNPQLLQTITDGVPRPYGIWVDAKGVVYVVNLADNSGGPTLSEYAPGASTPFFQITSGIPYDGIVCVDSNENVYISGLQESYEASYVEIFPPGASVPSQSLEIPTEGTVSRSESVGFDPNGNLLVGVAALPQKYTSVLSLAQGSQTFANLGLKRVPGGLMAADASGTIYAGGGTDKVAVYPAGATKPKSVILAPSGHLVTALAVDATGTLYVGSQSIVYEYAPGAHKPTTTLFTGARIGGLAVSSP